MLRVLAVALGLVLLPGVILSKRKASVMSVKIAGVHRAFAINVALLQVCRRSRRLLSARRRRRNQGYLPNIKVLDGFVWESPHRVKVSKMAETQEIGYLKTPYGTIEMMPHATRFRAIPPSRSVSESAVTSD
jgi:hypothetical protein